MQVYDPVRSSIQSFRDNTKNELVQSLKEAGFCLKEISFYELHYLSFVERENLHRRCQELKALKFTQKFESLNFEQIIESKSKIAEILEKVNVGNQRS